MNDNDLTDGTSSGTIQGGEGGVTKGDIDLLFEDIDNEFKHVVSQVSRMKFDMAKLMQRCANLVDALEYAHGRQAIPEERAQVQKVGRRGGGLGQHPRMGQPKQQQLFDRPSRAPKTQSKAAASPEAKKEEQ